MATLWTYLRIQAMVLICGIVGPIFLGVYFASQPEPTLKWMYYAGLIITAIDILVALRITQGAVSSRTTVVTVTDDNRTRPEPYRITGGRITPEEL